MAQDDDINFLINKKNYSRLRLYVDLGFDISLTSMNNDSIEKFGSSTNILFKLIVSNKTKLITEKEKKYFNIQNDQGYTPLHWAIICQRNDIIDLLLSESSNIYGKTSTGENCLSLAARYDNTYAFKKILQHKINLNILRQKNERGFNSLLFSAAKKNSVILKEVINYSDVKSLRTRNNYEANFLHWLFHGKNIDDQYKGKVLKSIFNLLIDKLNIQDIKMLLKERNGIGYTPIDWLEHYENKHTLNFIRDHIFL